MGSNLVAELDLGTSADDIRCIDVPAAVDVVCASAVSPVVEGKDVVASALALASAVDEVCWDFFCRVRLDLVGGLRRRDDEAIVVVAVVVVVVALSKVPAGCGRFCVVPRGTSSVEAVPCSPCRCLVIRSGCC
jgi:hypothetical protein